ncbi:MAG: hypothetical protein ACOY3K_06830 [Candidatus Omnitrophota bacterium]
MKKYFVVFFASLVLVSIFSFFPAFAAEVYYLGSSDSGSQGGEEVPPANFQQRLKDFVNFKDYGSYQPNRSGQLSGTILSQMTWQDTSGNISKSFLERGWDYLQEINLQAWERLWAGYKIESRAFMRKTDDRQIEKRRDVRLKDLNIAIYNDRNRVEFGDFYSEFSQFTLGASLEGFQAQIEPLKGQKIKAVAARSQKEDITTARYERHVAGGQLDLSLLRDFWWFSLVRLAAQAVTNQDDSSNGWRLAPSGTVTQDLENTVVGLLGEVVMKKYFTMVYEVARSRYQADEDSTRYSDHQSIYGTAFRLQPQFTTKWVTFKYLYYWVQPGFYTDVGSASPDKLQHQFSVDITPFDKLTLSLVENWYRDHLEHSARAYQTENDEKYITLTLRPFDSRRDFSLRNYWNYFQRGSDNPQNSVEAYTTTLGTSVNDRIWNTTVSGRYEYRAYEDEGNSKASSDYFNRFGFSGSRDTIVFGRRWYFSGDYAVDIRNTKTDDDNDLSGTLSLNTQYDLHTRLTLRAGYNLVNQNSVAPNGDSLNTRNFFETDLLVNKKRGSRITVRYERNIYNHEDFTQDYNESRVITKFASPF